MHPAFKVCIILLFNLPILALQQWCGNVYLNRKRGCWGRNINYNLCLNLG